MTRKQFFSFVAASVIVAACGSKAQKTTAGGDATVDSLPTDTVAIVEQRDTTPPPMFLMGADKGHMLMLYWYGLEEPVKTSDNADYFDNMYEPCAKQDVFRRNRTLYTNLMMDTTAVRIKYVDEVLTDPDGNVPSVGELHGREDIPSLCARYVGANGQRIDEGMVIVTDQYLKTRKVLAIDLASPFDGPEKPMPADVVRQLEEQYGMKAQRSAMLYTIGGRYAWGTVQFKGPYEQVKRKKDYPTQRFCLALDVLTDGDKVYCNERIGYYESETEYGWNADDEGLYMGCRICAAFEGPRGLELCYDHAAPESWEIGMFYLQDGQLLQKEYTTYHCMVDEETPVWKKDIAKMQQLYQSTDEDHGREPLFKYYLVDLDNDANPEIWMRDEEEEYGALFTRNGDDIRLVATETPKMKFYTRQSSGGKGWICKGGPAGGPSYYNEVITLQNSKVVETYCQTQVYDDIEASLNGKDLSAQQAKAYMDKLPKSEELKAWYWKELSN